MSEPPILLARDARGVAHVTLNRPARGNAYDGAMLEALTEGLEALAGDAALRAVVIRGAGRHFQAGADLDWQFGLTEAPAERALAASLATTRAMQRLNEFPCPTFAVVQGACFGGGVGLVCCVDVALATPQASFGITEVRVGVVPSPISTHLVHALGLRQARRYALTGERFDAAEALRIGLVHEVVAAEALEARLGQILDETLLSAPGATRVAKRSMLEANGLTLDGREMMALAQESWLQRASPEAKEGLAAFREKRRPGWAP
ncbi:enoyl-CoA hydratase-related protein [Falsiroseomonas oryzae]|uniref:enoyl-CoA hydratase-related protein n=1 Tax=Falsiroseomonas oryzae TaxID=2766473 RepID=UPI0022EB50D7|nr:enoyl-CoA hydratase-related protein [Roseomonas sp. MO-31]